VITLVQAAGSEKGMLVYRPIFRDNDPLQIRGFVLAVLRMGNLRKSTISDNSAILTLTLLKSNASPEVLGVSDERPPAIPGLSVTRPVFAFGRVFAVTAHAGPDFIRLHPVRAAWLTILVGLSLTGALSVVIGLMKRRGHELEHLVAERTSALRDSQERLSATPANCLRDGCRTEL
jgi:CHASE1-domain containing sensor protein